ncbi:MAG TPA: type I DNA topoisomerase, partial [Chlamydiales bacterium]|nr:type I DNA topoisomerase [Chlamydiales bacterium]
AIAWHIASILPKGTKAKRITFHAITRNAVLDALKHPRSIDQALVDAQQARRLLDRIVGYKISPILTRKVKKGRNGTSAGRVQSVALKLVVDREKEIEAFVPVEYWTIQALLTDKNKEKTFDSILYSVENKRVEKEMTEKKDVFLIPDQTTADLITAKLKKASYKVASIDRKEKKRNPVPPFITSTLQQEASRHFGFNPSRTMSIAQSLYEGVDLGNEGTEGLITYMRTDSVQTAPEAITAAREFILKTYGKEFLPAEPKFYSSKKSAQEAHEAIRPTNLSHPPEMVQSYLNIDQNKLYSLIWKRFVASQMNPAIYDTVSIDISTNQNMVLRATGSQITFKGYLAAYEEKKDVGEEEEIDKLLPFLQVGDPLNLKNVTSEQSFTKPPPRFTEASLVKELEKSGIGRPSTYATIMNKIQSREYTTKENQALKPTELGKIIAQMLEDNFKAIMNVGFTAQMEDQLELIAENKKDWKEIIRQFWKEFIPMVEKAEKEATVPRIETDINCPSCGHKLQKIWSRNKYFYGCSNYPICSFTAPLEAIEFNKANYAADFDWSQVCPVCGGETVIRHGRYGAFLGCKRYPDCNGIINIPLKDEENIKPEDMPNCPAISCDGKMVKRRSRFGKTFYSCSNFPDCDVIVNDLAMLSEKYPSHPKTPYVKKERYKKRGKAEKAETPKKKGKKESKPRAQKTYSLSPELKAVVGDEELSRPEVIKRMWDYIKEHKCQDPKNKRLIVPDAKLAKVFGSKTPIDMMKLSGILGKHLS